MEKRFIIPWLVLLFTLGSFTFSTGSASQGQPDNVYLPVVMNGPAAYFVSPNGSDHNPGTFKQPWCTLGKAARSVIPGDIVYVREGLYKEAVYIAASGSQEKPIQFLAYPGETPIVDGTNLKLPQGAGLIRIKGDWIRFSGFEVRNSPYKGVELEGKYDRVDHIFSHHHQRNGIHVQGDYGTVEDSRVWQNGLSGSRGSALTASRETENGITDFAILRNNIVWENQGMGINTHDANGTLIEGNIVHDNLIGNIYIHDASKIICRRNIVYMAEGSSPYGKGSNWGILLGDETELPTAAITVANNIVYGNNFNLKWDNGPDDIGGMTTALIANNTFVNGMPNNKGNANVDIGSGDHHNVRFVNNIIVQDDKTLIADLPNDPQVILSHNLWSRKPKDLGTGDFVADPKLARTGSPTNYSWFELTSASPAIGRGLYLPEVAVDFAGRARGDPPDLGALEYAAGP